MGSCTSNNNAKAAIKKEQTHEQAQRAAAGPFSSGGHFSGGGMNNLVPDQHLQQHVPEKMLPDQHLQQHVPEPVKAQIEEQAQKIQQAAPEQKQEAEPAPVKQEEVKPPEPENKEEVPPEAPALEQTPAPEPEPTPAPEHEPTPAPEEPKEEGRKKPEDIELVYKETYRGSPADYATPGTFSRPIMNHGPMGCMALEEGFGAITDIAEQLGYTGDWEADGLDPPMTSEAMRCVVFSSKETPKNYLIETARFYTIFVDDKPVYTNKKWMSSDGAIFGRNGYYYFNNMKLHAITRTPVNCTSEEQDQEIVWHEPDDKFVHGFNANSRAEAFRINESGTLIGTVKEEPFGEPFVIKLKPDGTVDSLIYLDGIKMERCMQVRFVNDTQLAVSEDDNKITILEVDVDGGKLNVLHRKFDLDLEEYEQVHKLAMGPKGRFLAVHSAKQELARRIHILEIKEGKCELFVSSEDLKEKDWIHFGPMIFYGYSEDEKNLFLFATDEMAGRSGDERCMTSTWHIDIEQKTLRSLPQCRWGLPIQNFNQNMVRIGDQLILTGYQYKVMFILEYNL